MLQSPQFGRVAYVAIGATVGGGVARCAAGGMHALLQMHAPSCAGAPRFPAARACRWSAASCGRWRRGRRSPRAQRWVEKAVVRAGCRWVGGSAGGLTVVRSGTAQARGRPFGCRGACRGACLHARIPPPPPPVPHRLVTLRLAAAPSCSCSRKARSIGTATLCRTGGWSSADHQAATRLPPRLKQQQRRRWAGAAPAAAAAAGAASRPAVAAGRLDGRAGGAKQQSARTHTRQQGTQAQSSTLAPFLSLFDGALHPLPALLPFAASAAWKPGC